MTPRLATRLTIHDPSITGHDVGNSDGAVAARGLVALPSRQFGLVESPDHAVTSPRQREALRRRLLCAADVLTAAAALVLVLTVLGHDRPRLVTLFGIPGVDPAVQGRRAVRPRAGAPAALDARRGAGDPAAGRPVRARGRRSCGRSWSRGTSAAPRSRALWLVSVRRDRRRAHGRPLAGRPACPAIERCLVIGDPDERCGSATSSAHSGARAVVAATLPLEANEVDQLDGPGGRPPAGRRPERRPDHHRARAAATADVTELIRLAKSAGVQVSVLPRMLEVVGSTVEFEDIDGMTMLGVRPFGLSRSSRLLKRVFDLSPPRSAWSRSGR